MEKAIKPWRPKRTFKDVLHDYGNEITKVECDNDQILVTVKLDYNNTPDNFSEDDVEADLKILADKLNEDGNMGNFSIVPRAKFISPNR